MKRKKDRSPSPGTRPNKKKEKTGGQPVDGQRFQGSVLLLSFQNLGICSLAPRFFLLTRAEIKASLRSAGTARRKNGTGAKNTHPRGSHVQTSS